jgi:hypothetical protein
MNYTNIRNLSINAAVARLTGGSLPVIELEALLGRHGVGQLVAVALELDEKGQLVGCKDENPH